MDEIYFKDRMDDFKRRLTGVEDMLKEHATKISEITTSNALMVLSIGNVSAVLAEIKADMTAIKESRIANYENSKKTAINTVIQTTIEFVTKAAVILIAAAAYKGLF